jgi:hypothetical protein
VTRLKEKADYVALEDRPVPRGSNVRKDQLIRLNPLTHLLQFKKLRCWS